MYAAPIRISERSYNSCKFCRKISWKIMNIVTVTTCSEYCGMSGSDTMCAHA